MTRRARGAWLVDAWYAPRLTPLTLALAALSPLFDIVVRGRRALYRAGLLRIVHLRVPVIVVGNITVGGTGKTPLVIALAHALRQRGWHPGVISRGVGGKPCHETQIVHAGAPASEVGDEPLLIARRGLPVAVARQRAAAGAALLDAHPECDVLIADDGLQHYALGRDVEIAVIDGSRGLGNGRLMPAGPLRERAARLDEVDAVVVNMPPAGAARSAPPDAFAMRTAAEECVNLAEPARTLPLAAFAGQSVHAIAGIGNAERFFAMLRGAGMAVSAHAFPDHHAFRRDDLALPGDEPVLMTEKDAVKCAAFADARCWFVPVRAIVDEALVERVLARLRA